MAVLLISVLATETAKGELTVTVNGYSIEK